MLSVRPLTYVSYGRSMQRPYNSLIVSHLSVFTFDFSPFGRRPSVPFSVPSVHVVIHDGCLVFWFRHKVLLYFQHALSCLCHIGSDL